MKLFLLATFLIAANGLPTTPDPVTKFNQIIDDLIVKMQTKGKLAEADLGLDQVLKNPGTQTPFTITGDIKLIQTRAYGIERLWRAGNTSGSDGSSVDISGNFQIPVSMLTANVTFDYTDNNGQTVTVFWPLLVLSEGDATVSFEFLINTRFGRTVIKDLSVGSDGLASFDYYLDYPSEWQYLGQTLNVEAINVINTGFQNSLLQIIRTAVQASN